MSEQNLHNEKKLGLDTDDIKATAQEVGRSFSDLDAGQVKKQARELFDRTTATSGKVSYLQVITCVATVGILINNRRALKFAKRVVENMDNNLVSTQSTIKALKSAGKDFTYYPGVGVWVD